MKSSDPKLKFLKDDENEEIDEEVLDCPDYDYSGEDDETEENKPDNDLN